MSKKIMSSIVQVSIFLAALATFSACSYSHSPAARPAASAARPPVIRTLADMLKACGNDWVNPNVIEMNFLVKPERFTTKDVKVFRFDQDMTTEEIVSAMWSKGYEPATIEGLLGYGAGNPEEQRKYPIIALGSSWVDPAGVRAVPYLHEYAGKRFLSLAWGSHKRRWGECRFLVSPQSSP